MYILTSIAPLIFIFVAMFIIALGVGWLGYHSGAKRYLKPLQVVLNGEVKVPILGEAQVKGIWEGRKVKIVYAPANRVHPEKIIIYYLCILPVDIIISRKRIFDKIKNRFKDSFKTGDVNFDSKYSIKAHDELKTKIFLDQKHREVIQRLFNLITVGSEQIPPLESKRDKQVLKIFESNKTILELKVSQIILKHYLSKISLPPPEAFVVIIKSILETMKELTE